MKKIDRFWAGILAHMAMVSLIQDAYGVERYLELARAGWISGWITVPIAVTLLLVAVLLMEKRGSTSYTINVKRDDVEVERTEAQP